MGATYTFFFWPLRPFIRRLFFLFIQSFIMTVATHNTQQTHNDTSSKAWCSKPQASEHAVALRLLWLGG